MKMIPCILHRAGISRNGAGPDPHKNTKDSFQKETVPASSLKKVQLLCGLD